jgi:E3 ubiquitin-protein ligase DOA10
LKTKFHTIDHNINNPLKEIDEPMCRICLCEEEPDNPIISPCKCTGSVQYIHLNCIQEWLEGKKHKKETSLVNSYIWRGLECEICKSFYDDIIIHPKTGKETSLLRYDVHQDAE